MTEARLVDYLLSRVLTRSENANPLYQAPVAVLKRRNKSGQAPFVDRELSISFAINEG